MSVLAGDYKQSSASAFAISKFMQSGSSAIAFAYSSQLTLYLQLLIGKQKELLQRFYAIT